uniref:Centrosomal protein POC5 n=1 Tax=Trypanosoma congolense (strain IL3000) TaxID=1068625 RepID=G0UWV8_TRYCI|nr:unnamed protein product [Trypanosoma congolense IL3000]
MYVYILQSIKIFFRSLPCHSQETNKRGKMGDDGAEQHDEFLRAIGNNVDVHTTRMRDDILHMLSHYMKQQRRHIRNALRNEATLRENELIEKRHKAEAALESARRTIERQNECIRHVATVLWGANSRCWLQRLFSDWKMWLLKRRQHRRGIALMGCFTNITCAFHAYTQWRLLAAARRHHRLALAEQLQWKRNEAELKGQVQALGKIAEEERRSKEDVEDKLRTAFIRGVCALNKEAVQVLKGSRQSDEAQLSPPKPSGTPPPSATAPTQLESHWAPKVSDHPSGSCDKYPPRSTFSQDTVRECPSITAGTSHIQYHMCYAPSSCAYSAKILPHQPFVVSVDPSAVRSYGEVPSTKRTLYPTQRRSSSAGRRFSR